MQQERAGGPAVFYTDLIGYEPTDFAVIDIQHGRAPELAISLLGGDREAPDWSIDVPMPRIGDKPLDLRLPFDVTGRVPVTTRTFWLRLYDYDIPSLFSPARQGLVQEFALELPWMPEPWTSPDAPLATIDFDFGNASTLNWLNIGLFEPGWEIPLQFCLDSGQQVWGDVDGDGDPDLLASGYDESVRPMARVLINDGGKFHEAGTGLPAVAGAIAAADFNNDGRLDLALAPHDPPGPTRIFYNFGNNSFSDAGQTLPAVGYGTVHAVDFNNDGRVDLALAVVDAPNPADNGLRIWLGGSDGKFRESGIRLEGYTFMAVPAFADFNLDGTIDFACRAQRTGDAGVAFIRNVNGQSLATAAYVKDVLVRGNLAWGDVDNDGRSDLAVAGSNAVLRNNTDGSFSALETGIPPMVFQYDGSVAWGDVDNDGLQDLAVIGEGAFKQHHSRVYRNLGTGAFQNLTGNLTGLTRGRVHLIDFDGDGDLDFFANGAKVAPPGYQYVYQRAAFMATNRTGQRRGLDAPNAPPASPAGLAAVPVAGALQLSWAAPADDRTPAAALTYNVQIGRQTGWHDVLSGIDASPFDGNRLQAALTTTQHGLRLSAPPNHAISWRVQAIDGGKAASAWSQPALYVPAGAKNIYDLNTDGRVDVADLVWGLNAVQSAEPARADVNGDGRGSSLDITLLTRHLLGDGVENQELVEAVTIGPEGGKLTDSAFELTVPAGAFGAPADLILLRLEGDRPFGESSGSAMYRIVGLPQTFTKDLPVSIAPTRALAGESYGIWAETTFAHSFPAPHRAFHFVTPEVAGGRVRFVLPARTQMAAGSQMQGAALMDAGREEEEEEKESITITRTITSTSTNREVALASSLAGLWDLPDDPDAFPEIKNDSVDLNIITDMSSIQSPRFKMLLSPKHDRAAAAEVMQALEAAHTEFKNATWGFSYARRTRWPVEVFLRPLGSSDGEAVISKWGVNHGTIDFNENILNDAAKRKVTPGHEFFHLVQDFYNGMWYVTKLYNRNKFMWLDEAASTWCEELFAGTAPYLPPYYDSNNQATFKGLMAGALAGSSQDHGYGLASLFRYFVTRKSDEGFPRRTYASFLGSGDAIAAIGAGSTDPTFAWWHDYVTQLATGKIYPMSLADLAQGAPTGKRFSFSGHDVNYSKAFGGTLPDLSGQIHIISGSVASPAPDAVVSHMLTRDDENLELSALAGSAAQGFSLLRTGVGANKRVRLDLPLAQWQSIPSGFLLPLVTNRRAVAPCTAAAPYQLRTAVTWTRDYTGGPAEYTGWSGYPLPQYTISAKVHARGLSDATMSPGVGYLMFTAWAVGETPLPCEIELTPTLGATTVTRPEGDTHYRVYRVTPLDSYKFTHANAAGEEFSETVQASAGGGKVRFTLTIEPDDEGPFTSGHVQTYFDLTEELWAIGDGKPDTMVSTSTYSNLNVPVFIIALLF